jgi:hypothetical protein
MSDFIDMLKSRGKGEHIAYRPEAGTRCLVSGPNCDDDKGYVYSEFDILWRDDVFVLYGKPGYWPNIAKWDHVICKPMDAA